MLTIDSKLAKRLGLKRTVATASASCTTKPVKLKLRFTANDKRKLAEQRKLKLALVVTLASGSQAKKTVRVKA